MEENITKAVRLNSYLRTLSVFSNKAREYFSLGEIHFYNENGIIVSNGHGYFDSDEEFSFRGEVVRRNKENFTRKENFVIKVANNVWHNDYALYVYVGNVDMKYLGLEKAYSNVYRVFEVNGIKVQGFVKYLEDKVWAYKEKIENEVKKLESYHLPLDTKEMKKICKDIVKYNDLLVQEKEYIKNYVPKEEEFEKDNILKSFLGEI